MEEGNHESKNAGGLKKTRKRKQILPGDYRKEWAPVDTLTLVCVTLPNKGLQDHTFVLFKKPLNLLRSVIATKKTNTVQHFYKVTF